MKLIFLSVTLTLTLVSAKPHYGRGSTSEWEPPRADDCMVIDDIHLLENMLIFDSPGPLSYDEYLGESWIPPSRW